MIPELESVVHQISLLPGIGRRSAARIAFHLLALPDDAVQQLSSSILAFKEKVDRCPCCGSLKQTADPCAHCETGKLSNIEQICVVEQPSDILAIENSGEYSGSFHVLHGALSPLDGVGPEQLLLGELLLRVQKNPTLKELIIATNPSMEGNTTANYIKEMLREYPQIQLSRIASGLALGSQLEYADSITISQSIKARIPFE